MPSPELRSKSGRLYRWPAIIAELEKTPGRWRRMFPDSPLKLAKHIRLRRNPALRGIDGTLDVRVRFPYTDDNGHRRGSIDLRYTPRPAPQGEQGAP